ncbi:hypothetical protein FGG08_004592 [Glutinoglossum americanum]|uniref:Uncharacterized protein n=1 Tax=Glutinoglossum americanum TaxID=1670608 RepID=A0A9P8L2B7_9PEZI|nr:hypothetical protein FGG08_004592 [Glutinoglossum americanum]
MRSVGTGAGDTQAAGRQDPGVPTVANVVKRWKGLLWKGAAEKGEEENDGVGEKGHAKWSLGVLNDKRTVEVPGSVLLLSRSTRQRPLGLHLQPARTSASSLPSQFSSSSQVYSSAEDKKKTANGQIILDPQPDDSLNDPLNWPVWRRNTALLSLGWHCLVGGGMTPILAAGFKNVAKTYHVTIPQVALTTGLYMMGLGVGSVVSSPTAILYGKRPVYLIGTLAFLFSAVWCSESPTYISLVIARIVMGLSVSPCESLPSATIAEIFFLHERAYRIVAIIVAFNFVLLFLFVPETFWDRTPRPKKRTDRRTLPLFRLPQRSLTQVDGDVPQLKKRRKQETHVEWANQLEETSATEPIDTDAQKDLEGSQICNPDKTDGDAIRSDTYRDDSLNDIKEQGGSEVPSCTEATEKKLPFPTNADQSGATPSTLGVYTDERRKQPPLKFGQTLKPWNGRLRSDDWFHAAVRPLILFAYPAVLWSALVYSLSVGWLIVLSETVASVYQHNPYNFNPLATGLVYLSPFVGGILGTVVAGKVSDIIVRFMTKRNGGVYEPEFRLVMAIPVAVATSLGLVGFGWSADVGDKWIVPTIFFGVISFGCSLGSTTAITFCVDSYRQYAGEALVTLNFSKNVFHGLVFSLFFNHWLDAQGPKRVFLALGGIQLACLAMTIPLYIFGKRARMWTVRKNFMEKF